MSDQDTMLKEMESSRAKNIVTTGFENDVPSKYKVHIVEIGTVFSFDDPRTERVGPYKTDITSGEYEALFSQPTEDCCDETFGVMKVTQEGVGG